MTPRDNSKEAKDVWVIQSSVNKVNYHESKAEGCDHNYDVSCTYTLSPHFVVTSGFLRSEFPWTQQHYHAKSICSFPQWLPAHEADWHLKYGKCKALIPNIANQFTAHTTCPQPFNYSHQLVYSVCSIHSGCLGIPPQRRREVFWSGTATAKGSVQRRVATVSPHEVVSPSFFCCLDGLS